jgi:hypothetical protein
MSSAVKTLGRTRLVTVVGLIVGAAGIVLQRVAGVDMPVVPPGLVMLVAAAVLIVFTRGRWAPAVGALVALAEVLALVMTGAAGDLLGGAPAGAVLAIWVRAVGVLVALVAGVATAVTGPRRAPSATASR